MSQGGGQSTMWDGSGSGVKSMVGSRPGNSSMDVVSGSVKVLARDESTKYLGRLLSICEPNDTEIEYRI